MKTLLKHTFFSSTLLVLTAIVAQAADITVNESTCTLADAITAANTDIPSGGCSTGSENDTVILQTDVALVAALPDITSTITIEGNGHKIDGQNNSAVGSVLTIADTGNLTLNGTTVTGGNATEHGGGINNYNGGTLALTNSTVTGNKVAGYGGGIENYNGGTVTLTNSTISGNWAEYNGGGIDNYGGTVTLTNSTVSNNSTNEDGGGIENYATVTLINSTVSGNSAKNVGGGIDNYKSTVMLINSTVSNNSAEFNGGGINVGFDSTVTLNSCLISGNSSSVTEGKEIYNSNGIVTTEGFNLFGHSDESSAQAFYNFTPGSNDVTATSDGTIPTALNALLHPLADNGGPTKTHALVTGSPAVDLDASCSTTELTTDQRGYPRPLGEGCDAGSFEGSKPKLKAMPWLYLLLLKN
jgi:hypothetical protein